MNENTNKNIIKNLDEIINCNILNQEMEEYKNEKTLEEIEMLKESIKEVKKKEIEHKNEEKQKLFSEVPKSFDRIFSGEKNDSEDDKNSFTNKEIVDKKLYEFYLKISEKGALFAEKYCFSINTKNIDINQEKDKIKKTIEKIKKFEGIIEKYLEVEMKKISLSLKESKELEKELRNIQLKIPVETLNLYEKTMGKLIENGKFKNIYFQEKKMTNEKIVVYKKNVFDNIGKHNFKTIYPIFLEEKLAKINQEILNSKIEEKIIKVDMVLTVINKELNSYSNKYVMKVSKLFEEDEKYFRKMINKNKKITYQSYEEFKLDYNYVSEYKKTRDLVNFNMLNKINHYLIEINWKLAIQMARLERDIHYMVRGLNRLDIVKYEEIDGKKSRPYPKYNQKTLDFNLDECHYKFRNEVHSELVEICGKFGIDLSKTGELQKVKKENIRNYISHFYLIRMPFNKEENIGEKIDKVSKLLLYRTKYNNSTYNGVFEVFKKDVTLNYNILRTKFRLEENSENIKKIQINEIIIPKKVSILKLEHYNGNDNVELIKELLTYKNPNSEAQNDN